MPDLSHVLMPESKSQNDAPNPICVLNFFKMAHKYNMELRCGDEETLTPELLKSGSHSYTTAR